MFSLGTVASKRRRSSIPKTYRAEGITTQNLSNNSTGSAFLLSPTNRLSDSKQFTLSCWINVNTISNVDRDIYLYDMIGGVDFALFRIILLLRAGRALSLQIRGSNPDFTIFDNISTTHTLVINGWMHILLRLDANTTTRQLYINDTLHGGTPTFFQNNDFLLTGSSIQVVTGSTGGQNLIGCLTDYWVSDSFSPDLSVETNRRLFIDSEGKPSRITADGTLSNGQRGDIYLTGNSDTFLTNKGSAGGTVIRTGEAISNCPSSPSD